MHLNYYFVKLYLAEICGLMSTFEVMSGFHCQSWSGT